MLVDYMVGCSHYVLVDYMVGCSHYVLVFDAPFTVRHFLIKCDAFSHLRYTYYQVDDMTQLFQDIYVDNIMMFLKEIRLILLT